MKISKKQLTKILENYLLKEYHPDFGEYIPNKTGEVREDLKSIDNILYTMQPYLLGFSKISNDKNNSLPFRGFARFWMDDNSTFTEDDLTYEQKEWLFYFINSWSDFLFKNDAVGANRKKAFTYDMYDKVDFGSPVKKIFSKEEKEIEDQIEIDDEEYFKINEEFIHFLGQFHVVNFKDYYLVEDYYDFNNNYKKNNKRWERNSLPKFLAGFAAIATAALQTADGVVADGNSLEDSLYAALRMTGDVGMKFGLNGFPIKIKIKKSLFK
tara:strand:+ start:65 stop:868 length:804 start_codon:yes stop_codon:yes gene_type:complete